MSLRCRSRKAYISLRSLVAKIAKARTKDSSSLSFFQTLQRNLRFVTHGTQNIVLKLNFSMKLARSIWSRFSLNLSLFLFFTAFFSIYFSPVLFSGRLLAPGDGFTYYLPSFLTGYQLWEPNILCGYPVAADPQAMTWYPLSRFFSLFNSWNGFVLSAYVLASSFMCGYVYSLTRSSLAGMVSGIVYGLNGFMIVHLGHTSIIHAAVWLPLLIWSTEKQHEKWGWFWFTVSCLGVAFVILAGHSQISLYALTLWFAYVIFRGWSAERRWRFYFISAASVILGLMLAAIQIVPSAELAGQTVRSKFSFQAFVSYSLPPIQILEMLFPYLFGNTIQSFYAIPYFGKWNRAELSGYVGLLTLMMSVGAILSTYKISIVRFWLLVVLVSFLLVLGEFTPLSKILYHLPVYNKFRVPARHFLELDFGMSVLAGIGAFAAQKRLITVRQAIGIVIATAAILAGCVLFLFLNSDVLASIAATRGYTNLQIVSLRNPAFWMPILMFLLTSLSWIVWTRYNGRYAAGFLILSLIIDLGSFGWFCDWRDASPNKKDLLADSITTKYRTLASTSKQRLLPAEGSAEGIHQLRPNSSRLWEIPNASGYGSLHLTRFSKWLSILDVGSVKGTWSSSQDRSLDLAAVRYVMVPRKEPDRPGAPANQNKRWSKENLPFLLGYGCGPVRESLLTIQLLEPIFADTLGVVSAMSCSTRIPNNQEVVEVKMYDTHDNEQILKVRAGRDTSEWSYDCARENMRHERASIYESFGGNSKCPGYRFDSLLPLDKPMKVHRMEFRWIGPSGLITFSKVSLFDEKAGKAYPVSSTAMNLADQSRWRFVEEVGGTRIYENLRAFPRAWFVRELVTLEPREILSAIRSSRLPDNRLFDPTQVALVEDQINFRVKRDPRASIQIQEILDNRVLIHTESINPAFLVLSDVNYPGWSATIDGKETEIYLTNYVLRGVKVPAGKHVIDFRFRPLSLYLGAGISFLAIIIICVSSVLLRKGNRKVAKAQS